MAVSHSLDAIEHWMQAAILSTVDAACIDDTILPSSQLSSVQRLAIYQRAYLARLVECLRAEFPMVCRALGEGVFDELATDYLTNHPSTSYTLSDLGQGFPQYLSNSFPRVDSAAGWYESIVELASLEWVTSEVFHGPGTEDTPPFDASRLVPEAWDSLALTLTPCTRLMELHYPVHEYWRALRDNVDAMPPVSRRVFIAVSRLDYTVRHNDLSAPQFALLKAIEKAAPLSAAIEVAGTHFVGDLDQFASELHVWFSWFQKERWLQTS